MSKPADSKIVLSETLHLCEYKSGGNKGFWLWDSTRGMNLAMRAKNETEAFTKALSYYQKRLQEVEHNHKELATKVNSFLSQFEE